MSNYISIEQHCDAAFALRASAAGAAGTWAAETYSFLLIAWDSADETDVEFARFINQAPYDISDPFVSVYNGLVVTANQTVTLTWTPPRRRPHHYAVYVQTAATYSYTSNANKILPAAANRVNGDIPGWATSVVLPNATHVQRLRQVRADASASDDSYTVRGNRILSLHAGNTVVPYPTGGGGQNIDDTELGHDDQGEFTKIYVTSTVVGTDDSVKYPESPIRIKSTTAALQQVLIDPVVDTAGSPAQFVSRDHKGMLHGVSQALPYSQSGMVITAAHISFAWSAALPISPASVEEGAAGVYQLLKWMEARRPVRVTMVQDQGTSQKVYYFAFVGLITGVNDYAFKEIQSKEDVEIMIDVQQVLQTDADVEYWYIIAGSATDGLKAVSTTAYDSTNDETDIVFTDTETASISGDLTAYLIAGSKMRVNDSGERLELWDRP